MTLTCITFGTEFKREYSYGSFFDWHLDSKYDSDHDPICYEDTIPIEQAVRA